MSTRVLVADDTVVFRRAVSDALSGFPDIEVVGTAVNGRVALAKIEQLKPDLITLDIEMPEMNGIEVLQEIRRRNIKVGVIIVSAMTAEGSALTMRALELGAFDFVTKSAGLTAEKNIEHLRDRLLPRVRAFVSRSDVRSNLRVHSAPLSATDRHLSQVAQRMSQIAMREKPEMVLIGVSTGGPTALLELLPKIPGDINVPILIVQHMPPIFTQALADSLSKKCAIRVKEAQDGELALPNAAYIAPGGKQMKLVATASGGKQIVITNDPPENNSKPAVDYLFRSVANNFSGRATAVIMTGMGSDGTLGLKLLKRQGCSVVAQDEASCVVFGMPREAIRAGVVDVVVPLDRIVDEILKSLRG